jgi:drug/metabolite transporter (DMT)-like permease
MHRLPLATVSVIMYVEPASAVVWAAAVLDEIPDTMTWFGIALVVIGGVVAATASAQEEAIGAPAAL